MGWPSGKQVFISAMKYLQFFNFIVTKLLLELSKYCTIMYYDVEFYSPKLYYFGLEINNLLPHSLLPAEI